MANHTGKGTFKKGRSGNPGGRPKVIRAVQELARENTVEAMETLIAICNDKKVSPNARVAAANAILDRGWGKAPATVNVNGPRRAVDMSDEELLAIIQGDEQVEIIH